MNQTVYLENHYTPNISTVTLGIAFVLYSGLTTLNHTMETDPPITPFPPGHFEVFNLKMNGKVESIQLDRFHSCSREPKHIVFDTVGTLASGDGLCSGVCYSNEGQLLMAFRTAPDQQTLTKSVHVVEVVRNFECFESEF